MADNPFTKYKSAGNPFDKYVSTNSDVNSDVDEKSKNILTDTFHDAGIGALKIPGMVAGLADIPAGLAGIDRPVSKAFDKVADFTGISPGKLADEAQSKVYSKARQQSNQNVQQAWDDYDKGNKSLIGAIGETVSNPRTLLGNTIQSLPSMAVGGIGGKALLGTRALAPAVGEGAVMAGQQMDNINDSVDPQKAAALSLGTGVLGAGLGYAGGKAAKHFGLADPESVIGGIAQAGNAAPLSLQKRVVGGAASEGLLEELPQSMVEQGAQNIAEDKPVTQGMARAATEGALAGGMMGGAFNVLPVGENSQNPAVTPPENQVPDKVKVSPTTGEPIPAVTETSGPLGSALNAGAIVSERTIPGLDLKSAIDNQYQDSGYNPLAGAWESPSFNNTHNAQPDQNATQAKAEQEAKTTSGLQPQEGAVPAAVNQPTEEVSQWQKEKERAAAAKNADSPLNNDNSLLDVSAANSEKESFNPTHTTSDGTPVIATDEPNIWFDGQQEIEDSHAELINADSHTRSNATPDTGTTSLDRGASSENSGTGDGFKPGSEPIVSGGITGDAVPIPRQTQQPGNSIDDAALKASEELPPILTQTKAQYLVKKERDLGLNRKSPGYADAKAKLELDYDEELIQAFDGRSFEAFSNHPDNKKDKAPESAKRRAWESYQTNKGTSDATATGGTVLPIHQQPKPDAGFVSDSNGFVSEQSSQNSTVPLDSGTVAGRNETPTGAGKGRSSLQNSEEKVSQKTEFTFPSKTAATLWAKSNVTGDYVIRNDPHDSRLHHIEVMRNQIKSEPRQWYLDADDKPVLLDSSAVDGERGPYLKSEVKASTGYSDKQLNEASRQSKPESIKQPSNTQATEIKAETENSESQLNKPADQSSNNQEKDEPFHQAVTTLANDLVKGGGVSYTYDTNGNINGRTPSVNPDWFKDGKFTVIGKKGGIIKPSVKEVQDSASAHESGASLTDRQRRILRALSDIAEEMEQEGYNIEEGDFSLRLQDLLLKAGEVGEEAYLDYKDSIDRGSINAENIHEYEEELNDYIEAEAKRDSATGDRKSGSEAKSDEAGSSDFLQPIDATNSNRTKAKQGVNQTSDLFVNSKEEQAALDAKQETADFSASKDKKRQGDGKEPEPLFSDNPVFAGQVDISETVTTENVKQNSDKRQDGESETSSNVGISKSVTQKSNIQDFGEKIGGAKKDTWTAYNDKLGAVPDAEIKEQPLSKSWPETDYQSLIDSGIDAWSVSFVRAARDEIPNKPQSAWKQKPWAEKVKLLRQFTQDVMSGEMSKDMVRSELAKNPALSDLVGRIELYEAVGHSQSLKGVRLRAGKYSLLNGIEYKPPKIIWSVEKDAKATAWSNFPKQFVTAYTKEQAIKAFKDKFDSLTIQDPKAKEISFDITSRSDINGYFVSKKIGRNFAEFAGPFQTIAEARAYRTENNTELLAKLEKFKEIPKERRDTNNPRVGEDMRGGQDVTPELFSETFGFRGVEFGNYVESKKRQQDLNDSFDALMDMASILGIPPKSISLNGSLGLAFGARGSGGINPASAHYETDKIVINLTKKNGAGSLGHEWWHSLDNYFSRMRNKTSDYMTDALDVSLASRGSNYIKKNEGVRDEMIKAYGDVVKAIKQTAIKARSSKLDVKRSGKDYWTTQPEMSARAFESYLISKLQDQNASNDYLANIVDEQTWKAAESLGFELDESYPYPTAGEIPTISAAFQHFFSTIEHKQTESGTALYSRTQSTKDAYEERIDQLRSEVDPAIFNGIKVLDKSDVLDMLGFGNYEVVLAEKHAINDGMFNHGLTTEDWKKVPEWIENPLAVFYRDDGRMTFIAPELKNGKPILIGINPESGRQGRSGNKLHVILTAYDKNSGRLPMERMVKEGMLRYVDTRKSPAYKRDSGYTLPSSANDLRGYRERIFTEKNLVKYRNANQARHSKGQSTGSTVAEVTAMLPKRVKALLDAGKLKVVQSVENLPEYLQERGTALYHAAWHGSPYDYDKFSLDKIGTGEGAQAFGYGLYFTDKKDIAEYYKDTLSQKNLYVKGEKIESKIDKNDPVWMQYLKLGPTVNHAIDTLEQSIENYGAGRYKYLPSVNELKEALMFIKELIKSSQIEYRKDGKLYQVELSITQDEYLDWDKPLSEQSEKVKAAIEKAAEIYNKGASRGGKTALQSRITFNSEGSLIYESLATQMQGVGIRDDKGASDALHSLGIRGIRYRAEGGKSDASNYVIFNDEDVSIANKYSKLASVEALYDNTEKADGTRNDTVYLVADAISKDTINPIIFHELYHRGLATDDKLKAAHDRFTADMQNRFNLAAKGIGTKADKDAYARVVAAETPEKDLIEEFGAYQISAWQQNPESVSAAVRKAIADFIAAIRAFLIRNGFDLGFIKSLTPADLAAMSRYGANVSNSRGLDSSGSIAMVNTLFSKAPEQSTSLWRRWFGQSKMKRNGQPIKFYHGSQSEFTVFDKDKLATHTTHSTAGLGHFFTEKKTEALGYGDNVHEVFLSIERPFVTTSQILSEKFKDSEGAKRFKDKLIAQKFDGVYIKDAGYAVAFDSYQAKLTSNASPTFASDIRYSKSAPQNTLLSEAKRKAGLGPKKTLSQTIGDILTRGVSGNWQAAKDKWADMKPLIEQGMFDKFLGIRLAEQEILGDVAHSVSGYIGARLSTGSSSTMQALLLHGAPKWDGGIIQKKDGSKSFAEILQPVKDDLENFAAWMVGRRADRLYQEGRENNFSRDEIDALLGLEQDSYQGVADDIAAMNSAVLDLAQEVGLVDSESRKLWESADYIPFYRLVEGKKPGVKGKSGLSHQSSGIKLLKGSENPLSDPLGNMMQNWAHLIDASMKNSALDKTLKNLDGSRFVESIPRVQFTSALIPKEQIKKLMLESGLPEEIVDAMPPDLTNGIAKMWAIQAPTDPDIVRVMRNGKTEYFRVNDGMLLTSLTALNQMPFGGLFKPMRYMKRLLTGAVTADPTFMARNFVRDAMHSWAIAEEKGFKLGIDSIHGAIKSFKEEGGYVDMMFAGASFQGGYGNYNDPDSARDTMDAALRKKGIKDVRGFKNSVLDTPKKYFEMYRSVGDAIENASREAILENSKRSGAEKAQYLFEAKDLMDFSMQGSFTLIRAMSDMLPFFNARLVGLYRLVKAGKTAEAKKMMLAKGLSIAMFSLALLALNSDNDDYEALEDWDKDQYWHFFFGDQHYRLPKPFELGLMFGTIPERSARYLFGPDSLGKFSERMVHGAADTLAFNPIPQLFKPFVELYSNKDMFTGRPIEGMADEGKLPSARYNERTSETMRELAQWLPESLGASPKRLEHLLHGYLGAIGMYALGATDVMVRELSGMPELPAARLDSFPVIRGFYQGAPALHTKYSTELYDMLREVDQVYRTVNDYRKQGDLDKANELVVDNADKLKARKPLTAANKQLSALRKQVDIIYRSNLSAEVKRESIDKLMMRSNEVARLTVEKTHPYFED